MRPIVKFFDPPLVVIFIFKRDSYVVGLDLVAFLYRNMLCTFLSRQIAKIL